MRGVTHDERRARLGVGVGLALVSAASFGLSGTVARGLLEAGWSPGAAVTARIWLGALVLLVPGLLALRGRFGLLRRRLPLVATYGVLAVAGCQLCYFFAIEYLQVGVALLIEYAAPAAVVLWMWLRHGQAPSRLTLAGAAVALAGLVLVLDLVSGGDLDVVGVLWALGAMVGVSAYFVISADEGNGLPPLSLAAAGLVVGGTVLTVAGVVGLLPMDATTARVSYVGLDVDWWVPVLALGVVTAALSYSTGIAAGRRLGPRVASFVGLFEVVFALVFAWLLLAELPRAVQLLGGALILAGVVLVRRGEARGPAAESVAVHHEPLPG